jgi:glutaredoxin
LFEGLNAQVLGISVDHIPCLIAWAESLGGIAFPLLSDFWPHGAVAERYGVLRSQDGKSERALFVLDRDGIVRYIDVHDIDDRPDNEELRRVLREIEGVPFGGVVPIPAAAPSVQEKPMAVDEIIVYCARWCKDCRTAKNWLDERNLKYVEIDIDYDTAARKKIRQWTDGRLITPVFEVGDTVVLDFNIPKLEQALLAHGLLKA